MDRLVDRFADLGELELTLRRIVTGARVVAAVWMAVLMVVALFRDDVDRPVVALVVLTLIAGWAIGSVIVFRTAPDAVTSRAAHVGDAVAGAIALLGPTWAQTAPDSVFTGGLPLITVAVAAVRSPAAAWTLAAAMIAVTIVRAAGTELAVGVVASVSQIILYAASAVIFNWVLGVLRDFDRSRREAERSAAAAESQRVREAERAQISRHLHDSVLQTLALIQRSADSETEVRMLARKQERELRGWLYGDSRPGGQLVETLERAANDVEERLGVTIEVVSVGDAPISDRSEELVAAVREAMTNAARHAGVSSVSVYLEVGDGSARVFVRDRGVGFEPASVGSDRRGISESIEARIAEAGGKAELKTTPGRGTEWRLEVPL
jgi:signal transduction histidine kinase